MIRLIFEAAVRSLGFTARIERVMLMRRFAAFTLLLGLTSCVSIVPPRGVGVMSDYFHWQDVDGAKGWVVILPGSSGLTVLDDERHYFDAADALNAQGWNVLLVDYKPAYRAAMDAPGGDTGEKIAWVTERAIAWMIGNRPEMGAVPGAVVAWSLGAEGALYLANDRAALESTGIRSIAMYYPSIPGKFQLDNHVPLLILTGESDDVTPVVDVNALVAGQRSGAKDIELHTYPNAHHGFDVASIQEEKTVRMLPLVGPSATLHYNADAATDAADKLAAFLGRSAGSP